MTSRASGVRLRLLPDTLDKVPPTGALGSVQAGELELPEPAAALLDREFLRGAAHGYWRHVRRVSLGLVRVVYAPGHEAVVLLARPLVLLRFREPEYEIRADRAAVTWRIERGLLVARDGRDRGFLRLTVTDLGGAGPEPGRARVEMEVRNFYPWLRGSGRFARLGAWLYAHTQQRLHRWITRGFLRAMARNRCYI